MMSIQSIRVLVLCLSVVILVLVRTGNAEIESFRINCGANSSVNIDGKNWVGDLSPERNFFISSIGTAILATEYSGDSTFAPLFRTAQIFTFSLNYTFSVTGGNYCIRLYFYPYNFDKYNVNESYFDVIANGMNLVSQFNVPIEVESRNMHLVSSGTNLSSLSLIKEYFLNVDLDVLVVEFNPIKGSFGFVNAIEIVPIAGTLFVDSVSKVGGNSVKEYLNFSKWGIETMYRLNVGSSTIEPKNDPELSRMWESDSDYMFTADAGLGISNTSNITYSSTNDTLVAPLLLYETARTMSNTEVLQKRFNMSWKFQVDPGFDYLIRLHFCELVYDKANQRLFRIYINNRTASDSFDIFVRAGGMNKAYHHDYLDAVSYKISSLWIQLGPDTSAGASGSDALLSGLEIFKLSHSGNLARIETSNVTEKFRGKKPKNRIWLDIGVGIACTVMVGVIFTFSFYCYKMQRKKAADDKKDSSRWMPLFPHRTVENNSENAKESVAPARVGKRFMLSEIRIATNNFDEMLVIGVGGFGKVYKGKIDDYSLVAIKRGHPRSEQGLAEFETEIEMLSKLRHRHLVSMIGFCEEQNEMILVYEYMANGTLRSHLFGSDLPPLPWKKRLEVCIGAAKGLHYLHTGAERGIIHRDIKTTNILLDEKFVAKMADFGLSKAGPLEHTHVSTAVKGSFGYLDPEYFRRQQLTEKSDVYSFGVVLFEVICARAVINPTLPKDQINLAEWAMRWQRQRSIETIIDPHLKDSYCPESLKKFGDIAEKCIADEGRNRPTMGEVLWHLEYVLQLHEAWLRENISRNSFSSGQIMARFEERDIKDSQESNSLQDEIGLVRKMKDRGESSSKATSSHR